MREGEARLRSFAVGEMGWHLIYLDAAVPSER